MPLCVFRTKPHVLWSPLLLSYQNVKQLEEEESPFPSVSQTGKPFCPLNTNTVVFPRKPDAAQKSTVEVRPRLRRCAPPSSPALNKALLLPGLSQGRSAARLYYCLVALCSD